MMKTCQSYRSFLLNLILILILPTYIDAKSSGRSGTTEEPNQTENAEQISLLVKAAAKGDTAQIVSLLEKNIDVNGMNKNGWIALHSAASGGHSDVVEILIGKGAKVNAKDKRGFTPLYFALWKKDPDLISLLIKNGAAVNFTHKKDYPPLHYAVWNDDLETARLMVNKKVKINKKDKDGWTAFRYAVHQGNRDMVKLFISRGVRVCELYLSACTGDLNKIKSLVEEGTDVDVKDEMGWTALYWAASTGQTDVANYLINSGADVNAVTEDSSTALHQAARFGSLELVKAFISKGADLNAQTKKKETPLHLAAEAGHTEVAMYIINHGAELDANSVNHQTALHYAAKQGHQKMVKLLVENNANRMAKDKWDQIPLWIAKNKGHKELFKLLVPAGSDLNTQDDSGQTFLHKAATNGWDDISKLILDRGGYVNAADKEGMTPLYCASEKGCEKAVEVLLSHGAQVDYKDHYGRTPLHGAAASAMKNTIHLLLAEDAPINARDNAGRTALHYVSGSRGLSGGQYWSDINMVRFLLDKGANVDIQDNRGWSSLHYAARIRNIKLVKLLLDRGADIDTTHMNGQTPLSLTRWLLSLQKSFGSKEEITRPYVQISNLLTQEMKAYYVANNGNDFNPGTLEQPFKTLNAAIKIIEPGETIFLRGGFYNCPETLRLEKSGQPDQPIHLKAYPNETPMLDFSTAKVGGICVTGAYWYLKGLTITRAEYWGIRLQTKAAHHNILEQITTYDNGFTGISLVNEATHNLVINCDSYRNFDPVTNGESADGFNACQGLGIGNVFIGCRAWNNADDGFDCGIRGSGVRLENCYAWRNGENLWNYPYFAGNGNGFKLWATTPPHTLIRCVAWDHHRSGFTDGGDLKVVTLNHCTSANNTYNYMLKKPVEKQIKVTNSLSFKPEITLNKWSSWSTAVGLEVNDCNIASLDEKVITGPRSRDGSIPKSNFLRLTPTSNAIDAGKDVGLSYTGSAPDCGAFEHNSGTEVKSEIQLLHHYVRDHNLEEIQKTIREDTDLNEKDWLGYAPLHWACYFGYRDLIELLLENGADPALKSDTGRNPHEIAKAMKHKKITKLLRKHQ